MQEIRCAFTSHRPKKFPWGYDGVSPLDTACAYTSLPHLVYFIIVKSEKIPQISSLHG